MDILEADGVEIDPAVYVARTWAESQMIDQLRGIAPNIEEWSWSPRTMPESADEETAWLVNPVLADWLRAPDEPLADQPCAIGVRMRLDSDGSWRCLRLQMPPKD